MAMSLDYEGFKYSVKAKIGLDLNHYKEQQMCRRINQLMQRYKAANYDAFLQMINDDANILKHFTDYLTINTSQFFRDPAIYRALEERLLPELLEQSAPLKVWSAGCSVGAEPYSLSMLLTEQDPSCRWRILATDFDVNILAKAKEARYSDNVLNNVPQRFMKNYFRKENEDFVLDERIKKHVQFRRQNLLTDRFESGWNLILCRNVFIYFTVETQEALIKRFAECLQPGGKFIIGCSEMITNPARFGLEKIQPAIYCKAK